MRWKEPELILVTQYARLVVDRKVTYYKACKILSPTLERSFESVRSKLKERVRYLTTCSCGTCMPAPAGSLCKQ